MPQTDPSYARLPERFFAHVAPARVRAPKLLALNLPLAARLGLDAEWLGSPEGVAMLAGNAFPEWATPIAQAYAGHQFGGFVPSLGDGRALLLSELLPPGGGRFDLALKGSGRTPFSRGGDGRAWLGPVLREYLVSEAMAALGVPTTRALAAVATGETVLREQGALPGAVLVRVAASHIRVGTFEFFAARRDTEALATLAEYARARHYPQAEGPLGLLTGVVANQAQLIAQWMSLGFIHGVMNTDNMAISGETIDYGPCAFIDAYHPDKVFSSIDRHGRYAFAQQPNVALWNLAQLASALLPLIGEGETGVEPATAVLDGFWPAFAKALNGLFAAKIGIAAPRESDTALVETLLARMARQGADFTRVFHGLANGTAREEFAEPAAFDAWAEGWQARLSQEADPKAVMRAANPARIPRNHRIEAAIVAATAGDMVPFERLREALALPFDTRPEWDDLAEAPAPHEAVARTFCGT
ncbi:YdiU family protein [Phaeovulum sp.]|uniref:protein adenylyltransferase SelO n=1 Tax=Phaeovulum sp. TaxID=2934796 RepID=UPI003564C24F